MLSSGGLASPVGDHGLSPVRDRHKPLKHSAFVHNGHLRAHVTLTLLAERLAAQLSLPVFTT